MRWPLAVTGTSASEAERRSPFDWIVFGVAAGITLASEFQLHVTPTNGNGDKKPQP